MSQHGLFTGKDWARLVKNRLNSKVNGPINTSLGDMDMASGVTCCVVGGDVGTTFILLFGDVGWDGCGFGSGYTIVNFIALE